MFFLQGLISLKDKALVEGAVKIIYTSIFTRIDQKVYTSLEALNADILIYLHAHNSTLLTGCDYSRLQQFEALEKNMLKPLNKYPYGPMTTKTGTVGKTGFVTVDHRYYSIPYKFIGKKVKLMYNRTKVEAFNEHELLRFMSARLVKKSTSKMTTTLPPGINTPLSGTRKNLSLGAPLSVSQLWSTSKKYYPGMNTLKKITEPASALSITTSVLEEQD
jgi:hypothetical protein